MSEKESTAGLVSPGEITLGAQVRPIGTHIARSHIGEVIAFTTPYECPTCGTTLVKMVRVKWADGRIGDWLPQSLEVIPHDRLTEESSQ